MDPQELKRLNTFIRQKTKPELTKLCQEKNLPVKGTKHDLAVRLLGISFSSPVEVQQTCPTQSPQIPSIFIEKNENGQYIHSPTRLLFDKTSRKVFGRLDLEGKVQNLSRSDIHLCRQFKFQYILPELLDPPKACLRPIERSSESDHEDDEDLEEM